MSTEDQALSTGKTVLEYVASKRRLATLQAEIARVADQLSEAGAALRERAADPLVINGLIGLVTFEKLQALTTDLQVETRRHEELRKSIRGIGLEG